MEEITIESDWYKDFFCIGGECGYTCCGGWNIGLSQQEVEIYRNLEKDIPGIMNHIDEKEKCMHQVDGHCSLITEDGWCTLVRNYGEAAISRTCQLFPRSEREYGNVAERHVAISCPTVAKNLFVKGNLTIDNDNQMIEADNDIYRTLLPLRNYLFELLTDDKKILSGRVFILLKIGLWVQENIQAGTLNEKAVEGAVLQWQNVDDAICEEMAPLDDGYDIKAQMIKLFINLYGENLGQWLSRFPTESYDKYAPEIFSDLEVWKEDEAVLKQDVIHLNKWMNKEHPFFVQRYLEQMVYMSFIDEKPENYDLDFFFRYVELVFIELFFMSRLRHEKSMEINEISVLVAWLDRKLYYNANARTFVANTVKEINASDSLELYYFPVY